MQVVTNENMAEFIQNRSVPDFVPPKADAKAEVKAEVKDADLPSKEELAERAQARGEDGKFVKAEEKAEAAKAAGDEEDTSALTGPLKDKIDKIVNKKHLRMKEAEEFAREMRADREAERTRAEKLQAELDELRGKSRPADAKDPKEPKADDFKTVGEYAEALAEYKVEKKFAEREAKAEQQRREQAAMAAQETLNKRIAATVKELPDYAEVIAESDIDAPPHIAVYIAESPLGPKIGYHFAKHPEDFDRINALSPIRAIAELGKLEDRLEKPAKAKEPEAEEKPAISRAPSPITPLEGKSAQVQKDPAKMSIQELRIYEREQRLARARR
jgi:hypothetical protein